jgi:lysozyme
LFADQSLAYNIGVGAFCGSTLVALLNQGLYVEACSQILRWDKAGGRQLRGLTIRREAEHRTCIGEGHT